MNWFNILKVLQPKTGYAQLDFDSITEEEESNCKKRWQQICDELSKVRIEGYTHDLHGSSTQFNLKDNPTGYDSGIGYIDYNYSEDIPEEVYCKALELLDAGKNEAETLGKYYISFSKQEQESYLMIFHDYSLGAAAIGYITNPERPLLEGLDMEAEVQKLLPKLKEAFPY